jgi:hypothetical protein
MTTQTNNLLPDTIYLHSNVEFIDETMTRVPQRPDSSYCRCVAKRTADGQSYELVIDIDANNPTKGKYFSMKDYGIIIYILFSRMCAPRIDKVIRYPFAATYGMPPSYFAEYKDTVNVRGDVFGCRELKSIDFTLSFTKIKSEVILTSAKAQIPLAIMLDWMQYTRESFNQELHGF